MDSGFTFEFLNRGDGLPGLQKTYGFSFRNNNAIDGAQRYIALAGGEVQIIDAFSTDGLLKKFSLTILKDDKKFFPPYYAVPLLRKDTAAKYPELTPLVEKMGDLLTEEVMMELNYQVDELQMPPREVALAFLKEKKLIPQTTNAD